MRIRPYVALCAVVTAAWVAALLTVPPFAQAIEQVLLLFLSSAA